MAEVVLSLPQELQADYEAVEPLFEGKLRSQYKVRHRESGEVRVVKVMRAHHVNDENLQLRFRREARAARRIVHPHIARFYDFVLLADRACLIKEHIPGRSLLQIINHEGPPEVSYSVRIALQVLDALAYIHGEGYVHRDVAPDNFVVEDREDGPMTRLADLGIAKRLGGGEDLTEAGTFVGKARYSAPEQFKEAPEDPRSDIYSFGVVLYELLTGLHPVRGNTFADHFRGHVMRPPRDFEETDPYGRVPEGLRDAVRASLEKEPEKRYQDAREFAEAIEPFVNVES